jgi:ABC-type multidrug transport system ATPase subunit
MASTETTFAPVVADGEAGGGGLRRSISHTATDAIQRTFTNRSIFSSGRRKSRQSRDDDDDSEKVPISKAEDWKLMPELRGIEAQGEQDKVKGRKLGVTWTNLTVKGVGADAAFNENMGSQFNLARAFKEARQPAPLKTILDNTHGCVKPGEMLLVLGRPGSGCTTLLKVLSNARHGYAEISGDVSFGSMNHTEAKQYRGQIVMNTEDEIFFPTLTVGQTIDFATRMKIPHHLPSSNDTRQSLQEDMRDFLLRSMGISHTHDTKIGNEFVRGVSGGERKRVSIIECLATKGSVFCWDNSTRGLDASTALEYIQAVRALTDVAGLASIVTLYQAGNGIYDLFDKILVLDEGKEIYYGPMKEARPFMEELGFICEDSANVADFLTGVTVPTERRVRPDKEMSFPRTAADIRTCYQSSTVKELMEKEYAYPKSEQAKRNTDDFRIAVQHDKHSSLPKKSPLTIGFFAQVQACIKRQYQIILGDKATFFIKQGATLAQALVSGSLFYNAPNTSSGLFVKSGALFFTLLYNSLVAMSEVTDSFTGRP